MNPKQIARIVLLAIVVGSVAVWAGKEFRKSKAYSEIAEKSPAAEQFPAIDGPQVVMTYFLLGKRCTTCRILEAFTKATAEQDFADELASHRLVFRVIDTEQPAHRHYLKDYQLTTKTVIISRRLDGKETEWKDMEKVWDLVDEETAFRAYLGEQIREYLGT
ncbi:MAG TPA: nitrophenyl compound nitroreductase subunit ArsF family protein [Luteolibacter sp.]|nr:nitrophenyl compound nitroreductase subunit ArsF family protein [Luteolibacter sp.]